MTNQHDPIEAWLSRDVELLPPPQGAFERVRRQARRRKAVQAMSVAAGVAVFVAVAAGLPQLVGNLLPNSRNPEKIATGRPPSATRNPAKTTSPSPRPSATRHGPPLWTAGRGKPLPAAFSPSSVTFVNRGVLGAVIGQGGSSCGTPCVLVAGTRDYGSRWTEIGAPPTGPPAGASGVSQIRFADRRNGWAYGPALWATHDGGTHWANVKMGPPSPVVDLATVSGRVFAVSGTGCTGTGANYAVGCTGFLLFNATTSGHHWNEVTGGNGPVTPGGLQLNTGWGYLLAGGQLWSGPLSGGWKPVVVSRTSPATPSCLTRGATHGLIAPTKDSTPNSGTLYLACPAAAGQRAALYASGDGGRTWHLGGWLPRPHGAAATSLAVSPTGPLMLATTAGIYYSNDARAWHRLVLDHQFPGGFRFVGMTTASKGVAVPLNAGLHEVFVTHDGGRTWRASKIT